MSKKVVHKRGSFYKPGQAKCGVQFYNEDRIIHVSWNKVTCKRCLKMRKK